MTQAIDLEPYLRMVGREVNCWNVVERFYRQELGIELPTYETVLCGMPAREDRDRVRYVWPQERDQHWIEVDAPDLYDLIDIYAYGMPHVAIELGGGRMLHKIGQYTRTQDYRSENWQSRIRGFYRHPSRMR